MYTRISQNTSFIEKKMNIFSKYVDQGVVDAVIMVS